MPDISKKIDSKKYMWEGYIYETEDKAKEVENDYKKNNFETAIVKEDEKYLVYTRRVVTEIVLEGEAPI